MPRLLPFRNWTRSDQRVMSVAALVILGSLCVVSLSRLADAARIGIFQPPAEVWLLETSSHLVILALAAFFPMFLSRVPETARPWRLAAFAVAGALGFACLHIAATYMLRELLFPLAAGRPYELSLQDPGVWLYEVPKDALTYATLLIAFAAGRHLSAPKPETAGPKTRIPLRCGGSVRMVYAADVIHARSAGNYVEVFTAGQTILARMTLSELEKTLTGAGSDHARIHRTCLVHLGHISAVTPTGEGDVSITLDTGAVVPGSRRYRDRLGALSLRTAG